MLVILDGRVQNLGQQLPTARLAAQHIERLVASGGRDPAARVGRKPFLGPSTQRRGEGLLNGVFGELEVTDDPREAGHDLAGLLAKEPVDGLRARHPACRPKNGRTSIGSPMHAEVFAAQDSAPSRSGADTM